MLCVCSPSACRIWALSRRGRDRLCASVTSAYPASRRCVRADSLWVTSHRGWRHDRRAEYTAWRTLWRRIRDGSRWSVWYRCRRPRMSPVRRAHTPFRLLRRDVCRKPYGRWARRPPTRSALRPWAGREARRRRCATSPRRRRCGRRAWPEMLLTVEPQDACGVSDVLWRYL